MTKAVNRLQVVPNNAEVFDNIETVALMKTDREEAGEVLLVTKEVEEGKVDVLLVFPTLDPEAVDVLGDNGQYQPTGIRFTLNAFLNMARMVAIQHQAVLEPAPDEYTHDQAGHILVPGGNGHA